MTIVNSLLFCCHPFSFFFLFMVGKVDERSGHLTCVPARCTVLIQFRPPLSTAKNMRIRRVAFSWTCVQVNLFPDYCVIEFPHILVNFSCFRKAKLAGDRN